MEVTEQYTLQEERLLDFRIRESKEIIISALKKTGNLPLIVNFSGGKDSTVLLHLTQQVTDRIECWYMVSGLEFPKAIDWVKTTCKRWKRTLSLSFPSDYVTKTYPINSFYTKLEGFGYFPKPSHTWCSIHLKIRPQIAKLRSMYGRKSFIKLNGVRRNESSRRMAIYRNTHREGYMRKDYEDPLSFMVFPLLNWTTNQIQLYLKREQIILDLNPFYEKYGVSGCSWCAFYQPKIYRKVLRHLPNHYDRIIMWEEKLKKPSVMGHIWMRDLKEEMTYVSN